MGKNSSFIHLKLNEHQSVQKVKRSANHECIWKHACLIMYACIFFCLHAWTGGCSYSCVCRKCSVCRIRCMCIILEAILSCRWIGLISYNTNQSLSVASPVLPSLRLSPTLTHLTFILSSYLPLPSLSFCSTHPSLQVLPLMPCISCSLLTCCYPLTFFPLCQTFSPSLFLTNSPLCLPSPTLHITDGKQVLFSPLISSFPPCCFVALVSKWQECKGIWVLVGAGEKWERCQSRVPWDVLC